MPPKEYNILAIDQATKSGIVLAKYRPYRDPIVIMHRTINKTTPERLYRALKPFSELDLTAAVWEGTFYSEKTPMACFTGQEIAGWFEMAVGQLFGWKVPILSFKATVWRKVLGIENKKDSATKLFSISHPWLTTEHECEAMGLLCAAGMKLVEKGVITE